MLGLPTSGPGRGEVIAGGADGARAAVLGPEALPRYLLERGLLSPRELLDQGITVTDASRSHRVSLVSVGQGGGFAIKQGDPLLEGSMAEIERERLVYRLAASRSTARTTLPACVDCEQPGVLVLELLSPGSTVLAHHHALGTLPADVAEAIGRALGEWHGEFDASDLAAFPATVPWVFDVLDSDSHGFPWHDPAMAAMLGALPHPERFRAGLGSARRRWRRECLIHGDLRWDNCLIDGAEVGSPAVRLIDWEMADLGDPAWDLGGILQDYLAPAALAETDASTRHRAAAALWRAYAAAVGGVVGAAARTLLERSIAFAGVRMVQTSLEWAHRDGPQSPAIAPVLETSLAALEASDALARELLAAATR